VKWKAGKNTWTLSCYIEEEEEEEEEGEDTSLLHFTSQPTI
jgi:hypothetical protein